MRSFLGNVSNGMIFKIILVSHMLFLNTLNPTSTNTRAVRDNMVRNIIKAVIKSFKSF